MQAERTEARKRLLPIPPNVNGKLRKKRVSVALEIRIKGNVCRPKARKLEGVTYSKKELKQMLVW